MGARDRHKEVSVAKVEPHWLSVEDAKTYTTLGRETILAAIMRGELEAYERPVAVRKNENYRQYRISTDALDRWIMSQPPARETKWEN